MYKVESFTAQKIGRRHTVCEDSLICLDQLDKSVPHLSLYAVLDGHGDEKASEFVRDHLALYLLSAAGYKEKHYVEALRDCIQQLHEEIVNETCSKGGTTLSLALVDRRKYVGQTILAFLGDSPIFLRQKQHPHLRQSAVYQAFPLHDTANPQVAKKIDATRRLTSAPWESKRCPPKGINVYGSLGDALYEPHIATQLARTARTLPHLRDWQQKLGGTVMTENLQNTLKKYLEESEEMDGAARRQASIHSANTLAFYLSESASTYTGEVGYIQREPDVMSIATADIDMIAIGSDGVFPRSSFQEIMTLLKSADTRHTGILSQIAEQCIAKSCSDDQTIVLLNISEQDECKTNSVRAETETTCP